jgi:hypothetical protein
MKLHSAVLELLTPYRDMYNRTDGHNLSILTA